MSTCQKHKEVARSPIRNKMTYAITPLLELALKLVNMLDNSVYSIFSKRRLSTSSMSCFSIPFGLKYYRFGEISVKVVLAKKSISNTKLTAFSYGE